MAWRHVGLGGLFVLACAACGREDIELALGSLPAPAPAPEASTAEPSATEPVVVPPPEPSDTQSPPDAGPPPTPDAGPEPVVDDCSGSVPQGLLAARPPMGWNGYNAFGLGPELDEAKLRETVEALVSSGMQQVGYRYVNLDRGWELARSEAGERVFDPERLPSGIEALAEWVHSLGLLLGGYAHLQECEGLPGSIGYEVLDAASFARWGLDYLKYVTCRGLVDDSEAVQAMEQALAAAAPHIVLSLASAPFEEWMRDTAQLWRVGADAQPTWSSILSSIDAVLPLAAYARPGAFNDPDMLEVGNGELTEAEQRAQFTIWSILSAPLIAGNDLTIMTETTRAILTNDRIIALNQDPLGLQAALVKQQADLQVLAKPLAACGARAVVLFNRGAESVEARVSWQELWLEPETASVRDLWSDTLLDAEADGFGVTVPAHDVVALRVDGVEPPLPRGTTYLSDLRWTYATNGYGPVELDQTNGEAAPLDGAPIRLRGAAYDKGLGVHGPSLIRYRLGRACSRFVADVGIDDDQEGEASSAQFEVWADGERLFQSGQLTPSSPAVAVDVDLRGRRELRLFVGVGGDEFSFDHATWAGATLICDP